MLSLFCKHEDDVTCQTILQEHYVRIKHHGWALRYNIIAVWRCAKCNKITSKSVLYRNLHPDDYRVRHFSETGF